MKSKLSHEFIVDVLFDNVMLIGTLQPQYINPMKFEAPHKDSAGHNITGLMILG